MTHNADTARFFRHERLEAYRLALAVVEMVAERRGQLRGVPGRAGEQLERAVVGTLTNLCSGVAQEGAERRRYLRIALSEATEAGGAPDAPRAYRALNGAEYETLRSTLLRLCACLCGLLR